MFFFVFFQIGKHLLVFAQVGMKFFEELTNLREAVGVLQHHDALTGTSQQHVTNHYSRLLYEGIVNCTEPIDFALGYCFSCPLGLGTSCVDRKWKE